MPRVPGADGWMGNDHLVVSCEERGGRAVVAVEGEIDLATAPQLSEYLRDLHGDVVVDLTQVGFLDSSGIAALVRAQVRADRAGGSIALRNPRANVRRTLEVTGLEDWIEPLGDSTFS